MNDGPRKAPADPLLAQLGVRLRGTGPELTPERFRLPARSGAALLRRRIGEAGRLRQSAVLVPLVERDTGTTVLLTERSEALKHHAGQVSFPGGRLEPHDAGPREAALRETEEEVGIAPTEVQVIGYLDTYVTGTGFSIVPVVGRVRPYDALALDATEVASAFEVPLSYLIDPTNHRVASREFFGERVEFYEIDYDGRLIWGATAGIIVGLSEKIQGSED
ncbi:MAG: CoA pyrophosphatase [Pseudomonadota bacterium]